MSYLAQDVGLSDVEVEVCLLGALSLMNCDTTVPVATAVGEGGRGRRQYVYNLFC